MRQSRYSTHSLCTTTNPTLTKPTLLFICCTLSLDDSTKELTPAHLDVYRIRGLLRDWRDEQLALRSFLPLLLRRPKFWFLLFLAGFALAMFPVSARLRVIKLYVFAFVCFVLPVAAYALHRLELEACLMRAGAKDDLDDLRFNYVTGAVLIAEITIPRRNANSSNNRNSSASNAANTRDPKRFSSALANSSALADNSSAEPESDTVMIGFAAYRALSAENRSVRELGDLRYLYVTPGFRRRGVATLLLQEAYEHASHNGYKVLTADVDEALPSATHACLQDSGYRFFATDIDDIDDHNSDSDDTDDGDTVAEGKESAYDKARKAQRAAARARRCRGLRTCFTRIFRRLGCLGERNAKPKYGLFAVPRVLSLRGRKLTYERRVMPPWVDDHDDGDGDSDGEDGDHAESSQSSAKQSQKQSQSGGIGLNNSGRKFQSGASVSRPLGYGIGADAAVPQQRYYGRGAAAATAKAVTAAAPANRPRRSNDTNTNSNGGSGGGSNKVTSPAVRAANAARNAASRGNSSGGSSRDVNEALAGVMGDLYGQRPEEAFDGRDSDDDNGNNVPTLSMRSARGAEGKQGRRVRQLNGRNNEYFDSDDDEDDDDGNEEEDEDEYEVLDIDDRVPLRAGAAHRVRVVKGSRTATAPGPIHSLSGVRPQSRGQSQGQGQQQRPFWRPPTYAELSSHNTSGSGTGNGSGVSASGPRALGDASMFERYMALRAGANADDLHGSRYTIEKHTVDEEEVVKRFFG